MSLPLDEDFNDYETVKAAQQRMTFKTTEGVPTVDAIPTHGAHSSPREARGGAFAPADVPLIKDALYALLKDIPEDDERVSKVANLLHRLGRIS